MQRKIQIQPFVLLLASLVWGIGFVSQRQGGDAFGPYFFSALRFLLAGVALIPVVLISARCRHTPLVRTPKDKKTLWLGGLLCGVSLCVAGNLQQVGITLGTSVGKAGFLTACYIVLVPVLGIFLKKKCPWNVWVSVGVAVVGLYFLCIERGNFSFQISDALVLACSLAFAVQMLFVDHFAPQTDPVALSMLQFFICGACSLVPAFFVDGGGTFAGFASLFGAFSKGGAWVAFLYAGIMSGGVGYTLQTVGQRNFNPTVAGVLLSLESVFSVLAGWLILREGLTLREGIGCAIVFLAVLLAQISFPQRRKK